MCNAINKNLDRRERPRAKINSHINYKLSDSDNAFSVGKMVDLSQTGVLLKLYQEFKTHTQLTLQIKSDVADEESIEIYAEIIRIADSSNDEQHCYGCKILDIKYY